MVKVLLDNCYHMITVDLEYRQVIALSASFIETRMRAGLGIGETANGHQPEQPDH